MLIWALMCRACRADDLRDGTVSLNGRHQVSRADSISADAW